MSVPQPSPTKRGFKTVMLSEAAYRKLGAYGSRPGDALVKLTADMDRLQAETAQLRKELDALRNASDGRPSPEWLQEAFGPCRVLEKSARDRWLRYAGYDPDE